MKLSGLIFSISSFWNSHTRVTSQGEKGNKKLFRLEQWNSPKSQFSFFFTSQLDLFLSSDFAKMQNNESYENVSNQWYDGKIHVKIIISQKSDPRKNSFIIGCR